MGHKALELDTEEKIRIETDIRKLCSDYIEQIHTGNHSHPALQLDEESINADIAEETLSAMQKKYRFAQHHA